MKARLVARGCEESHHDRTDSPTGGKEILRLFLSIMASKNWKCNSIDIKAAFLQGENFQRDVYLRPPPEAENGDKVLWKLNKCVYGLNDAARVWYFTVRTFLLKLGCVQLKVDPAGFYWYNEGMLSGVLLMHVDDFIWGGSEVFKNKIVESVKCKFEIGNEACSAFKYLGLDVTQSNEGITLQQKTYMNSLSPIPITRARASRKEDMLNKDESDGLRSLIGQLNWLSTQTRPDISYDVLELSSSLKHPQVDHICKANKIVKKTQIN